MGLNPSELTGPLGGIIAIAYAAGAASGYAFCLRTMYKFLKAQAEKDEAAWIGRVEALERKLDAAERQIDLLQDRLINGMERQAAQVRESSVHLLGRDKLGGPLDD